MVFRIAFLVVVCVLPAMVAAIRPNKNPFCVKGRVYCDPCRAGFETNATTYIAGAEVILQCRDTATNDIVYSKQVKSGSSGEFKIFVDEKLEGQICEARLVSSPLYDCNEATPGRDHSRVLLNRFNGLATSDRFINNMGFMKKDVASSCAEILKLNQKLDRENLISKF
ncbi:Pollen protein Ole e I like [Sesbania bispinosa]|nr:Pollen protein Ole e I like [Sesbania bispinosa]